MEFKRIVVLFLALFVSVSFFPVGMAAAEEDVEGSKDHPLITRMPGFVIVDYEANFNATDVPFPDDQVKRMEGRMTSIRYDVKEDVQPPSELQIVRNYTNALTGMGAELIFDGEHGEVGGGPTATMKLNKDGREVWVIVNAYNAGGGYWLRVLEIEGMKQEVAGGGLAETLQKKGRVTVKINFDTGKANIKPDSAGVLDEIAAMMSEGSSLKLRIEGHTDNVGKPWDNLKLSLARAQSVAEALTKRGVAAERLAACGFGQAMPVADNGTDAGRAENRRVELVKM